MNKITFVVIAALALVFVFIIAIYGFGLDNPATRAFAKIIPVPAAVMDGRVVTLNEYYSSGKAIDELVSEAVMRRLASDRGVENFAVSILQERRSPAYRKAEIALREIRAGKDFAAAAAEYSDDEESKYIGGDIAILQPDEINPWLREEAVKLDEGQTSEIIISPEGYHILQLFNRFRDGRLHLRHILLRDGSWRDEAAAAQKQMRIYVFKRL